MPRLNRGKTQRVSIKLSNAAKNRIETTADTLSVSQASLIMYALSEVFQEGITQEKLLTIQNKIILEPKHFAVSMPKHLTDKIEQYIRDFRMKKGEFVGLLVSQYYENLPQEHAGETEGEPKTLTLPLHKQLKEIVYQYAEKNYLNVGFLIAQSIEHGRYKGVPALSKDDKEIITYNIPLHIYKHAVEQADSLSVPLHFYVESCVYNSFMSQNKLFELEENED
ncbi:hypothetical protein V7068_19055 [Bacillus sp. JJ634]